MEAFIMDTRQLNDAHDRATKRYGCCMEKEAVVFNEG